MSTKNQKHSTNGHERGCRPKTVMLQKNGYLRISYDMIQEATYGFIPIAFRANRRLELEPAFNASDPATRKLLYSRKSAKSPGISIKGVMRNVGVPIPRKSKEYKASQKPDGTVVVQF